MIQFLAMWSTASDSDQCFLSLEFNFMLSFSLRGEKKKWVPEKKTEEWRECNLH